METSRWPSPGPSERPASGLCGYRAEIDQATCVLMAQLEVGFEEAFIRLRTRAYARGTRISVVAADVVAHRIRLPPGTTPSGVQSPDAGPPRHTTARCWTARRGP
ncbi:ANTAR domain-containing protein [Streptomyces sp. NPDC058683]|uniref:ANTAR domain-containing protein n=1 Tax=Streptomyces sp. NPDC058683 TaxID=3346597 RepID=UPI0036636386